MRSACGGRKWGLRGCYWRHCPASQLSSGEKRVSFCQAVFCKTGLTGKGHPHGVWNRFLPAVARRRGSGDRTVAGAAGATGRSVVAAGGPVDAGRDHAPNDVPVRAGVAGRAA